MNWNRYTVNDELIVDRVYSYSSLERLIIELEEIVGAKIDLPHLKSNYRRDINLSNTESVLLERLLENDIYKKEYDLIAEAG